jgi:hypothetical protein
MADFKTQLSLINTERANLDKQERALLKLQLTRQKGQTVSAAALQTAQQQLVAAKKQLQAQVQGLHQGQNLDALVSNWEADVPLLMLPIRIQTRIVAAPQPVVDNAHFHLLVRIYPDDLYTCGHEDVLTDAEVEAGKNYWFAIRQADQTTDQTASLAAKKEAWRQLNSQFNGGRSLYISRVTMPTNRTKLNEALIFDKTNWETTKLQAWSKAAKTSILPDRFQVLVYNKSAESNVAPQIVKDGNLIPDTLQLGLDPLNEAGRIGKKNGEITVGEELKWITDFAEAERVGMGIRVPLTMSLYAAFPFNVDSKTPQGQDLYLKQLGIPRIVVVGTWTSADKTQSAQALRQFFDNHSYTAKGFDFLETGTPTNNTDNNQSAWSAADDPLSMGFFDNFKSFADTDTTSDGARLARALGIPKSAFQANSYAGKREADIARQVNTLLFPATIGYYFNELLRDAPLDRKELRSFVQQYLIGGGQLSAIRIGNQPYGLALAGGRSNDKPFYVGLQSVLETLKNQAWQPLSKKAPRIGFGKTPEQTLIDILSLHANSVEFDQDWFFPTTNNVSGKLGGGFVFQKSANKNLIINYLRTLGYRGNNPLVSDLLPYTTRASVEIPRKNLVKGEEFDNDDPLSTSTGFNYLQWLSSITNIRDLETLPLGTRAELTPVFFLMVRQAFLISFGDAMEQVLSLPLFKAGAKDLADKIMALRNTNTSLLADTFNVNNGDPKANFWEAAQGVVTFDETVLPAGAPFSTKPINEAVLNLAFLEAILAKYRASIVPAEQNTIRAIQNFVDILKALKALVRLPAAALQRAFVNHLDCAAHRLDAWEEGSIARRLDIQRGRAADGIYIGAFGWVEDLKMTASTALTEGGYMHAPSPAHATTAAVMKSAFMNHQQASKQSAFALNLPSARLQRAQQVVERMRNDERLEAILGYQFERELQDATSNPSNSFANMSANAIISFRKKYPIMALQLPQNATEVAKNVATSRNLTNGLSLAEDFLSNPTGWRELIPMSDRFTERSIEQAVFNLADTLDAVKDLLSAETAYRMAQGNFDAVGGTLDALDKGKLPHTLGFTEPNRQSLFQFSNRVCVHFDTEGVTANAPESPRATVEAGLNLWCTQILGKRQNIGFVAQIEQETGTVGVVNPLTLSDLGIQMLDFVCLSANPDEWQTRVLFAVRKKLNISDEVVFTVNFENSGASNIRPVAQVLPIALTIHRLISSARPLTALDYLPAGTIPPPSVMDEAEMTQRIQLIVNQINALLTAIKTTNLSQNMVLSDGTTLTNLGQVFDVLSQTKHDATADVWLPNTLSNVTNLKAQLIQLSAFGVAQAYPQKNAVNTPEAIRDTIRQAAAVVATTQQMLTEVQTGIANLPTDNPLSKKDALMGLGKRVFGGTMPMLPRFRYANADQIADSNNRVNELLKGAASDPTPANMKAEEWLQGAARVRPKLAQWESLRFMTSTRADISLDLTPVQVPTDAVGLRKTGSPSQPIFTWVATEFTEGVFLRKELVSMVVTGAAAAKTGQVQTGLLLDEWTESIPTDEETTGLAFNFNQPNTEAPQSLILAVCPDAKWSWQAVVNAVNDTLNRAKMRTVDLSHIRAEATATENSQLRAIGQLLPMLIAPVNVQQHSFSLDFGVASKESLDRIFKATDEKAVGHYQIWQEPPPSPTLLAKKRGIKKV